MLHTCHLQWIIPIHELVDNEIDKSKLIYTNVWTYSRITVCDSLHSYDSRDTQENKQSCAHKHTHFLIASVWGLGIVNVNFCLIFFSKMCNYRDAMGSIKACRQQNAPIVSSEPFYYECHINIYPHNINCPQKNKIQNVNVTIQRISGPD